MSKPSPTARDRLLFERDRQAGIFASGGIDDQEAVRAASLNVVLDSIESGAICTDDKPKVRQLREPKGKRIADRNAILERDGENCWFCGMHMEPLDRSIEHLDPIAMGGSNELENKVLCHTQCNRYLSTLSREDKEALRDKRRQEKR